MKRKLMEKLLAWKNKPTDRQPVILQGPRQVGKTYLLHQFGREQYQNIVYVNFETNISVASFFDGEISPSRILRLLEATFETPIRPGETLVIFDEIQACERALTSLKYFNEQAGEYHVIAAGSLLGVAINREKYSFPVGKVEILMLNPMDFEEFLWACSRQKMVDEIREAFTHDTPFPEGLHIAALELYKSYLVVGGMPGIVSGYLQSNSFIGVDDTQNQLLNAYIADMAKYASPSESVKIRAAYNSIPAQLAKDNRKFQYKTVQKGGSAALFGVAIDWLCFAGVALKCSKVEQGFLPLSAYQDLSSFKLYMGDVGLLTMKSGLPYQVVLSPDNSGYIFSGALVENFVAQSLHANGYPLYYWTSDQTAEIDFVLQKDGQVIPVEAKAGTHIQSRSLSVYKSKYNTAYSLRISARNFGFSNGIKSVPLYAVFVI